MTNKTVAIKRFCVEVMETLSRSIIITAEHEQAAMLKAQEVYAKEEMVLGAEDYISTEFNVLNNEAAE